MPLYRLAVYLFHERLAIVDLQLFSRESEYTWRIEPHANMRVPAIIYADEALLRDMDHTGTGTGTGKQTSSCSVAVTWSI